MGTKKLRISNSPDIDEKIKFTSTSTPKKASSSLNLILSNFDSKLTQSPILEIHKETRLNKSSLKRLKKLVHDKRH